MKSGHKALGILLVLCGLLLNPICLSWLFSNDGDISSNILLFGIIGLDALIILFGILVMAVNSSSVSKFGLAFLSVIFTIALTTGLDRFYGAFLMPETADLLFPSFSRAEHNTAEFDLDVQINNLGFRGPNTTIQKQKKRVVVIGDSFAFGWGVELEDTWVHLLSETYPEVEFLNLGQGGNHPGDYARIAKNALSFLNPDLVLVCVLQGNDIHQLMRVIEHEEHGKPQVVQVAGVESKAERYQRYLGIVYPNLTKRFTKVVSIQKQWKQDAITLLSKLDQEQRLKYDSGINQKVRTWFEDGVLNPSLVHESIHHPNMFCEAADTANPLYKKGVIRLHDHLSEVAQLCQSNGSGLLVVNLPNRPYGFPETTAKLEMLGYAIKNCDSMDASHAIKTATNSLGVALLRPTLKQTDSPLFFAYDGHWNAEGNRIFAQELIKSLEKDSTWKRFQTSSSF